MTIVSLSSIKISNTCRELKPFNVPDCRSFRFYSSQRKYINVHEGNRMLYEMTKAVAVLMIDYMNLPT